MITEYRIESKILFINLIYSYCKQFQSSPYYTNLKKPCTIKPHCSVTTIKEVQKVLHV